MTVGYEIEIDGLDEQITLLEAYDENSDRELELAMEKSVMRIEANVKPLTPVDRGRLRSSISTEVKRLQSLGAIVGRVGPSLKDEVYPQVMEFGRAPGSWPPIEPLMAWVKRVIRPPKSQLRSITYAIARKIYQNGIRAREYLKQGWEKSEADVKRYFVEALERIAEGLANGRI